MDIYSFLCLSFRVCVYVYVFVLCGCGYFFKARPLPTDFDKKMRYDFSCNNLYSHSATQLCILRESDRVSERTSERGELESETEKESNSTHMNKSTPTTTTTSTTNKQINIKKKTSAIQCKNETFKQPLYTFTAKHIFFYSYA